MSFIFHKFEHRFFGKNLLALSGDFLKSWQTSQRMLGPDFWDILSQDSRVPGRLLALSRHAVLRLAMTHDNPKYITVSDARKLFSQGMQDKLHQAEELMMEVRGLLSARAPLETKFVHDFMFWEMAAIEILLDKKDTKHFKTLEAALQLQLDHIEQAGGPSITTKWVEFRLDEDHEKLGSPGRNRNLANLVFNRFPIIVCILTSVV